MMNTLEIKNLSKTYRNGVQALDHVSLSITNGMFGLLGPNGAGKSTLMKTIATLQSPSSGHILFNDRDILQDPEYLRKQLGYLPQEFGVYPKVNAEGLLDHIAVLKGILDKKTRQEQVTALLQKVNLYQHRKKSVHTYSGGMKQRFGIAQALLGNPQIIIVDEPTAGLDPEERNRFLNLLSEIGENVIVILSTHIVEDVKNLCTNMAILGQGKILLQGNPQDLQSTLEGKIWTKLIERSKLESYQDSYDILTTRYISGKSEIQVLSESDPGNGFRPAHPDLESLYFSTINNTHI